MNSHFNNIDEKNQIKLLTIIISILGILFLTFLTINRGTINLIKDPLSSIGNLPQNYLIFLLGSLFIFFFVIIFIIKIYKKENIPINTWEIYVLPLFILLTLAIPYREEMMLARILHTTTGVLGRLC